MKLFKLTALIVACLTAVGPASASPIKSDETVVLIPTAARWDPQGKVWRLPLHAWIFEREEDDLLRQTAIAGLAKALGLPEGSDDVATFRLRARDFLVDNESGKRPRLQIGDLQTTLPRSGGDGHSRGDWVLPADAVPDSSANPWLTLSVVLPEGDQRRFEGKVQLIAPDGLSVISDLDDTVKITNVRDQRRLLENTFLKPFEAVPGMAETYRAWQGGGAVFHYVSSSPWQLYPALSQFLDDNGFPSGSFHLRPFRLKDESFLNIFKSSRETKPPIIRDLLGAYPERRFLLVGDSGEEDPEIYAAIARAQPDRIAHIYIRLVTAEGRQSARMQSAFEGLDPSLWTLFEAAADLPREP